VNLYFDPHANADAALRTVADIMPTDTQQVRSIIGSNADHSKYQDGSCQQVLYSSNIIAAAVSQANPKWTGDPHLVEVTLYTGNATSSDGSDQRYEPASVHLALISIADSDKISPC
jgi:hypothetical protein